MTSEIHLRLLTTMHQYRPQSLTSGILIVHKMIATAESIKKHIDLSISFILIIAWHGNCINQKQ